MVASFFVCCTNRYSMACAEKNDTMDNNMCKEKEYKNLCMTKNGVNYRV